MHARSVKLPVTSATESKGQLGNRLVRNEFVDPRADLFAAKAGELSKQRRRIELDDESTLAATENLEVWCKVCTKDLLESVEIDPTGFASACLLKDVTQEVASWSWIHNFAP